MNLLQNYSQQFQDGPVVVGKILGKEQYNCGFDAQNSEYGNLMTKGIIDPTNVVRVALQGRRRSRACSSPPKRWWPRCRRSNRQRRCVEVRADGPPNR
jgi:hypothetical protein